MSALYLALLFLLGWGLALKTSAYWFEAPYRQLLASRKVTSFQPLDLEVLVRVAGCQPPPRGPVLGYLLSRRALHSCHLFLGYVPWWAALLPRARVWVLAGPETGTSLRRAGRVLCRTEAELRAARRSHTKCQLVGFTCLAEHQPTYPVPAAENPRLSVLYRGDPSGAEAVSALWARHPDLPPLALEGDLKAHPVHLIGQRLTGLSRFAGAILLEFESETQLLASLKALASAPLADRARQGRDNQLRFQHDHERFQKCFPVGRPEVFFFTAALPTRTGGHVYNREMVQELSQHQVAVHCVDLDNVRTLVGANSRAAATPFTLALTLFLSWQRQLLVLDQVYAHLLAPALALRAFFGIGKSIVVVHHLEDFDRARTGWSSRWYYRFQLLTADLVVTVSQHCRADLLELGVPEAKIRVISGGASREGGAGVTRAAPGQGPVRLLFVGQCIARKGLAALLQAMARHQPQAFRLHLVGNHETGHFRDELAPLIEELQLGDQVVVEGRVDARRLLECYREADAFVFPSFQEGYGLAVLEAMLAGLPVLCSRTTALPELVEEGRHGYLFQPGNPEEIARALQRVLDEPEALVRLGQAARARALEEPTWQESRQRFFRALEPLLRW